MPERDVQIGAILGGKYRIERVLGQGGMGVVLEATQLDLDRRVALKFLRTAASPETNAALTRFEREARTIARLRGPHIVQIYDVGRLDHGEPFIVMELLSGEDLSALLDREKRLPVAIAVDYVLQACEAMAEAHVAGVVHRDLKPANLFLSRRPDGRPLVKVLDFGISKLMVETTSLNLTSGALGSPLYMSPEQLRSSKDIDHRTDVWSLGAILYELLSGTPAFDADGLPQICARIVLGAAEPIRKAHPEIAVGLESALSQALRRFPEERFPTVADLAAALMPFARKSALASAEAAIRIVQASSLQHGPLPQVFDSLPPPPLDATRPSPTLSTDKTVFSGPPSSVARQGVASAATSAPPTLLSARTVNVSGAPPAATQAELKPLVSPVRGAERSGAVLPWLFWAGLAIAAALAVTLGLSLVQRGSSSSAVSAEPLVSAAPPPPQLAPPAPELQAPAAPPKSAAAVAAEPPANAVPRSPASTARPTPTAKKAQPKPASEASPEDLLNHR